MKQIIVNEFLFKIYGAYAVYICNKFKEPVKISVNLSDIEKELIDFGLSINTMRKVIDEMIDKKYMDLLEVKRESYNKFITISLNKDFI